MPARTQVNRKIFNSPAVVTTRTMKQFISPIPIPGFFFSFFSEHTGHCFLKVTMARKITARDKRLRSPDEESYRTAQETTEKPTNIDKNDRVHDIFRNRDQPTARFERAA